METPEITVTVVGADPRDLLALRYEWSGQTTPDAHYEERFRQWWATEGQHRYALVAASAQGGPVGMANALVYSRMPGPDRPPARWLYAANVFVSATFRRRGVATKLMTELITYARTEGMERIVLAPSEMSKPMYRSLGFRPADDLMRLDLGDA